MVTRSPAYRKEGESLGENHIDVKFSADQECALREIKNDDEFVRRIGIIATRYRFLSKLQKNRPSTADERVTIDDLKKSVLSLDNKLNRLPGSLLQKIWNIPGGTYSEYTKGSDLERQGDMVTLQGLLQSLARHLDSLREELPESKSGAKRDAAKRAAAHSLKFLFERYEIKFSSTVQNDYGKCSDAVRALQIVLTDNSGKEPKLTSVQRYLSDID